MRFTSLSDWLRWQEQLHPDEIELGLQRICQVFERLHPEQPSFKVITVAGTNGKGSSVAMLEAILTAAGYRTGVYTSPHLLRYNERVRLNSQEVSDEMLCLAFERIDQARADTSLTYFEFGTLAALDIFYRHPLDVVILEVGMGGRLDAVNIMDADVALITAIDIDHEKWLGADRETIGYEKAGIMRAGRPVVTSDPDVPQSVVDYAAQTGAPLLRLGVDFSIDLMAHGWAVRSRNSLRYQALPIPALRGNHQLNNASGVIMALDCLKDVLPVSQQQLREGLLSVAAPGRFQLLPGEVTTILDVAHNPQSTSILNDLLEAHSHSGRTLAVVGMLADKSMRAALTPLISTVDIWYVGSLAHISRGATAQQLADSLSGRELNVSQFESVSRAYQAARQQAKPGDRIVVFGSFYTVAEVMLQTV